MLVNVTIIRISPHRGFEKPKASRSQPYPSFLSLVLKIITNTLHHFQTRYQAECVISKFFVVTCTLHGIHKNETA